MVRFLNMQFNAEHCCSVSLTRIECVSNWMVIKQCLKLICPLQSCIQTLPLFEELLPNVNNTTRSVYDAFQRHGQMCDNHVLYETACLTRTEALHCFDGCHCCATGCILYVLTYLLNQLFMFWEWSGDESKYPCKEANQSKMGKNPLLIHFLSWGIAPVIFDMRNMPSGNCWLLWSFMFWDYVTWWLSEF